LEITILKLCSYFPVIKPINVILGCQIESKIVCLPWQQREEEVLIYFMRLHLCLIRNLTDGMEES